MPRYAAIDIGSNSIRMEAAEIVSGQPARVLASEREVTRLGEGVFRSGAVSEEALRATCAVLVRMAAQYRKLDVVGVRAVATSAIRDTRNPHEFLARASEAAGTPVEIISGREEARLIYLGVESVWPQEGKRTLVIDIGGGSAEIIGAEDGVLKDVYSKPLGAVRLREIFLKDDPPSALQLHQMHEYIQAKLDTPVRRLGHAAWDRAISTSASAAAVAKAVARIPGSRRQEIDRLRTPTTEVAKLYKRLAGLSLAGRRRITGIGPKRAEIIVPGVAVLLDFLHEFQLTSVFYCRAGVRDGIIADLANRNVGAELSRLSRDQRREVEELGRRYGVSVDHARRVANIAHLLFTALQPMHNLPPAAAKLLDAAAYLIDVGHYVSDSGHHKHSYYVVSNSDMAGFTQRERMLVACLCRYHRKSLPSPIHSQYQALPADDRRLLLFLIPLLRLADNLNRSRQQRIRGIECRIRDGRVVLEVASSHDIDLEQWGAERAGEAFLQVYESSHHGGKGARLMREYACQQTALLLERMTHALEKAARDKDADSIHDVRVAMRRLSGCLRVFASFYPDGAAKKIRHRISGLMALAGAARDCDISIELVNRSGVVRPGVIVAQLAERRIETGHALLHEIRRWKRRDYLRQWRKRLEL